MGTHGDDYGPDPHLPDFPGRRRRTFVIVHGGARDQFGFRLVRNEDVHMGQQFGRELLFRSRGRVEDYRRAVLFRHPGDVFDHRHRNFELHEDDARRTDDLFDRAEFFGRQREVGSRSHRNHIFPAVVYQNHRDARGVLRIGQDTGGIDSLAGQRSDGFLSESVFPHFGDHPHGGTQPCGGYRLVCALAPLIFEKYAAEHRFARTRQFAGFHGHVGVNASDHDYMFVFAFHPARNYSFPLFCE